MFEPLYDLLMSDVDYESLLEDIKPYFKKSDLIIDAGCGSGYLLVEILKQGYTAIGLDLSSRMLSIASERLRSEGLTSKLYEHDLRKPIYANADIIIAMFDVMNYFKGVKTVFKNCYQSLYPEGRLIFDIYKKDVLKDFDGYIEESCEPICYRWEIRSKDSLFKHKVFHENEVDTITQYVYDLEYYLDLLKELGFKVEVKASIDTRKHLIIATK